MAIAVESSDTNATRIATHGDLSLDDLCNALYTSAQDNDLPVPFFANLIWQESRLRDDAVSRKGALGIAQFMPETAAENGLDNPFDPLQAIPASARFLRELRLQFGNLGFVAAAYNAGAHRVTEWLEHRGSLPRETRDYVVRVTGLSVDAWRSMPVNDDALTFVQHLPCRSLPAFASMEQAQSEQAQVDSRPSSNSSRSTRPSRTGEAGQAADKPTAKASACARARGRAQARPRRSRAPRSAPADHERHAAKREAEHAPHAGREKRKSVQTATVGRAFNPPPRTRSRALDAERDDALQQVGIADADMLRRRGEFLALGDFGIGIGFEKIRRAVGGETEIDAGIAVEFQRPVNPLRHALDARRRVPARGPWPARAGCRGVPDSRDRA